MDLGLKRDDLRDQQVFTGGPVQTDRGFVLHEPMVIEGAPENESAYASTMTIPGGLEMTTSKDVLEALSDGAGPKRVLVTLGYSSWDEGQARIRNRRKRLADRGSRPRGDLQHPGGRAL